MRLPFDQVCDLLPIFVMLGGLTEPEEERDGLEIELRAEVENEQGAAGTASVAALLHAPR